MGLGTGAGGDTVMRGLGVLAGDGRVACPLYIVCGWDTVDRRHLGHVVVIDTEASRRAEDGHLVTRQVDAAELLEQELRAHLATHRGLLQELLDAAVDGTR
jgi:hypothetical protein